MFGVFGGVTGITGEKGVHPYEGRRGEGVIVTNEEFIVPPYGIGYVCGGAHCRGEVELVHY